MRERIARERCIFVTNANQQDICQRSFADEVGLSRAKRRCFGLNRVQRAAIDPVTLPSADSLACSLLKKSAAIIRNLRPRRLNSSEAAVTDHAFFMAKAYDQALRSEEHTSEL